MILDIIIILLFLLVIFTGYKVGFLSTLVKIASAISGIIIAICLTQPVTNLAVEKGWNDSIEEKIYNNIASSDAFDAYIEGGQGVEGLNSLLKELGVPSFMSEFVAERIMDGVDPEAIAVSISESVGYIVTLVVVFFALLILSSVVFFILKLIIRSARKTTGLIRLVDGLLGVAFYGIIFIVVLYLVFFILSLVMKNLPVDNEMVVFMAEQLHLEDEKFGVAKYFYENNIITKFFELIF